MRALRPLLCALLIACAAVVGSAQDGLNLPADLIVLLNDGRVQRFGVGAAGVRDLTPEGTFVIDFGVDATGARLAYRTEAGLFVRDLTQDAAVAIPIEDGRADVPPLRGIGDTIAWTPGGDGLAYTTTYGARVHWIGTTVFIDLREGLFRHLVWSPGGRFLAAESESEGQSIWWVYRRDGVLLALTSIIADGSGAITWLSDAEIIFAPLGGGLRVMRLDEANRQIALLDETLLYRLPALDATDALVFFARDPRDPSVPEGYGRLLRLTRGAAQTESIGAVPVAFEGLRWSPGARLLVALQGGVMALFDPSSGAGFPLPINGVVAYDWGAPVVEAAAQPAPTLVAAAPTAPPVVEAPPPTALPPLDPPTPIPIVTAAGLRLSADGWFLAPNSSGVVQVWRLPADGSPPAPFTRNTSSAVEFAPSPVARAVAYVVDAELWAQVGDQPPFRLARLNSFAPVNPTFSPDGTTVYFTDESTGIWRIALEAARAREDAELLRARETDAAGVVIGALRRPQVSPDGTKLLIDRYADAAGTSATDALDLNSRQIARGIDMPPGDPRPARAVWLRDGRVVTLIDAASSGVNAPAGIYIETPPNFDGGVLSAPLPPGTVVRAWGEPLPGVLRLLVGDEVGADVPLRIVDVILATGRLDEIDGIGALIAPRLSADGRFIGGFTPSPGGEVLTVIDALTGARFVIPAATGASAFAWGGR